MPDIDKIQEKLKITFLDIDLLSQALTHSSFANENPGVAGSNERLEFLGDAILGCIVAENLYREHGHLTEGQMTKIRSYLVKQEALAQVARRICLGEVLYLGKGEEISGGRRKQANLARALEAVIAALYLDQGYAVTEKVVLTLLKPELQAALHEDPGNDYKSRLQELLQSRSQPAPAYHLVSTSGPDHARTFVVALKLAEELVAQGSGKTKKSAEMEAARLALEILASAETK